MLGLKLSHVSKRATDLRSLKPRKIILQIIANIYFDFADCKWNHSLNTLLSSILTENVMFIKTRNKFPGFFCKSYTGWEIHVVVMWNYAFLMSIIQALARYANPQVLVNHFPWDASVVTVVTRWTGQSLGRNNKWETDFLQRITPQLGAITVLMRYPRIARFMGPTLGPSGADRTHVGPMLAPWTLLSG